MEGERKVQNVCLSIDKGEEQKRSNSLLASIPQALYNTSLIECADLIPILVHAVPLLVKPVERENCNCGRVASEVESCSPSSQERGISSTDEMVQGREEVPEKGSKSKKTSRGGDKNNKSRRSKKRVKMIRQDYEAVVSYIEDPENFRQVMGGGLKTKVGGKCMSKTKVFHIMASHLKNVAGFPDVTGEEMKKRFERYVAMYKKARKFKDSTGQGLSEKELEKGMTIEDEMEKICPHFGRMHMIFGQRANIASPAEESAGLPSDAEDADMVISDSQPIEEDGNWKEDDDFDEGLTAVEEEHSVAIEEEHSPSVIQVEAEEGINLVDASYGSDDIDDDDIIGNQTEKEDPNEGFQDEINNAEQTRSEWEGSATETREEQPADAPGDNTLKYHSLGNGGNLDASKEGNHNMHSDDSDEDSSSSDE
ncbi:hypothetical protein R1sor_004079 [Riccia sorocarpa]|uniref:Uncharacterized protein n=1 Tax=Riccia sorocarpa TaxID=122646 RepID=A0ABD3H3G8_9MARC